MRFGIIANRKRTGADDVIRRVLKWILANMHQYVLSEGLNDFDTSASVSSLKKLASKCDLVISMGGDGTLLASARSIGPAGTPILGINLGSLGFLTQVTADQTEKSLEEVVQGKHKIEKRMLIETFVATHEQRDRFVALNDVVVDRGSVARLIELNLYVNNEFISTYRADGLIISTPTGSTAYNAAVGGPILNPNMEAILLSPMAPQSLAARPLLFSATDKIKIKIISKHHSGLMTIDGQESVALASNDEVHICKASYSANLVTFAHNSFYDILRNKLHWAVLPQSQS